MEKDRPTGRHGDSTPQQADIDLSAGREDCAVRQCDDGVATDERNNHTEGLSFWGPQHHRQPINGSSGEPDQETENVGRIDRAGGFGRGCGPSRQPTQADFAGERVLHGADDTGVAGHKRQLAFLDLYIGDRIAPGELHQSRATEWTGERSHLGAKGFKSGSIKTIVDGELPLGILRGAIDETLATLPNQDDLVEIAFIGDSRPSIRISRYRHEQLVRDGTTMRWLAPSTHTGATPVARMILDPRHEHALEPQERGVWQLPERCKGPCLVYLRDGVDVVSRPVPVLQPGAPDAYAGVLVSALTKAEYEGRQLAVIDALARLGRGEAGGDDLVWLRDAATNLNGLPASALDGLKLLPSSAETLIHLLLSARDAGERAIIWALQNELPFLWLALPLRAWLSAMDRQCTALTSALEPALGREKAMSEAVAWLRGVCGDLTALEPAVEIIFAMAGLPTTLTADIPSLRDLTSGYIRDQHQRGGDAPNDLAARLALEGLKLPLEIQEKSHTDFAGLFAPVLLAASAREKLDLSRELALIARRTLREDPTYASGAWPRLVKFFS
jgi:hypothetical protein